MNQNIGQQDFSSPAVTSKKFMGAIYTTHECERMPEKAEVEFCPISEAPYHSTWWLYGRPATFDVIFFCPWCGVDLDLIDVPEHKKYGDALEG